MMSTTMTQDAVRASEVYNHLRPHVETEENTGKLLIIDPDSGDYEIDENGIESSQRLLARHPNAHLWAFRIGFKTVEALGGILERSAS
jgi:hypothetical protein